MTLRQRVAGKIVAKSTNLKYLRAGSQPSGARPENWKDKPLALGSGKLTLYLEYEKWTRIFLVK